MIFVRLHTCQFSLSSFTHSHSLTHSVTHSLFSLLSLHTLTFSLFNHLFLSPHHHHHLRHCHRHRRRHHRRLDIIKLRCNFTARNCVSCFTDLLAAQGNTLSND